MIVLSSSKSIYGKSNEPEAHNIAEEKKNEKNIDILTVQQESVRTIHSHTPCVSRKKLVDSSNVCTISFEFSIN